MMYNFSCWVIWFLLTFSWQFESRAQALLALNEISDSAELPFVQGGVVVAPGSNFIAVAVLLLVVAGGAWGVANACLRVIFIVGGRPVGKDDILDGHYRIWECVPASVNRHMESLLHLFDRLLGGSPPSSIRSPIPEVGGGLFAFGRAHDTAPPSTMPAKRLVVNSAVASALEPATIAVATSAAHRRNSGDLADFGSQAEPRRASPLRAEKTRGSKWFTEFIGPLVVSWSYQLVDLMRGFLSTLIRSLSGASGLRSFLLLVIHVLVEMVANFIAKVVLYFRAIQRVARLWRCADGWALTVAQAQSLDRDDPDVEVGQVKRIFFIRHGESIWNAVFNKGYFIFLPIRLMGFMLWELLLLCERDSVMLDSPLTPLGISQALDLGAFLASGGAAGSGLSDENSNSPPSCASPGEGSVEGERSMKSSIEMGKIDDFCSLGDDVSKHGEVLPDAGMFGNLAIDGHLLPTFGSGSVTLVTSNLRLERRIAKHQPTMSGGVFQQLFCAFKLA
eukprot:GHVN01012838.1.p1 GENE.GHVN01012838.1~~GHVN01012838.1.p1  ORF type:complete len:505 (+),score=41.49 GHVN01012838.1:9-1523(+)